MRVTELLLYLHSHYTLIFHSNLRCTVSHLTFMHLHCHNTCTAHNTFSQSFHTKSFMHRHTIYFAKQHFLTPTSHSCSVRLLVRETWMLPGAIPAVDHDWDTSRTSKSQHMPLTSMSLNRFYLNDFMDGINARCQDQMSKNNLPEPKANKKLE